ncbi:MAG: dicarboxylate transporter/tellurite-resistance protein TehA [Lautropia sp.]|nr:dicarboxylate transporter/tellurite-resistance protein TehA [Lautropia sp.]
MNPSTKPFPVPISYFGMALGSTAWGLSWRFGASAGLAPVWLGEVMLAVVGVVWLSLMIGFVIKLLGYRQELLADLHDPVRCCFLSMVPITTILTGMSLLPYLYGLGLTMIVLGTLGQLSFAMYRSGGLWRGGHSMEATTPVIYLPTVGAGFVSAMACKAIGLPDYGMLFFGAGMLSWFGLEAAILLRLRIEQPLPPPMRGVLGITVAPSFVAGSAYLEINGGHVDAFALMVLGYGILHTLFSIRLLPWLTEGGFSMSLWGYSFAMAAMTGCGLRLVALHPPLQGLGWVLAAFGSAVMLLLVMFTVRLALQGRFLVRG